MGGSCFALCVEKFRGRKALIVQAVYSVEFQVLRARLAGFVLAIRSILNQKSEQHFHVFVWPACLKPSGAEMSGAHQRHHYYPTGKFFNRSRLKFLPGYFVCKQAFSLPEYHGVNV